MSLEDLMRSIIASHSSDHLQDRLEWHNVHLWQRDTEAELYEQLDAKVHQFSVVCSPYGLVSRLCNKKGLIAMLRDQFPEVSEAELQILDTPVLIERVLETFEIPPSIQPTGASRIRPMGASRIRRELERYKEEVDLYVRRLGRAQRASEREAHRLRGLSISYWTYLEELLKQVLGFYAFHFGRTADAIAQELRTAFVEVCRVRSKPLGHIIKAFEEIEFIFEHGESHSHQKTREKRIKEERKKAYSAQSAVDRTRLEDAQRGRHLHTILATVVDRTRLEDETASQHGKDVADRLREECMDAFGRDSPFSSLPIHEIQKLVKRSRNPYAHETIDQLIKDDPTGKKARESITSVFNFVEELISKEIAPRLVFLIAEGKDAYGRRFISYIGEEQLDNEEISTYSLNDSMHFYHNTLPFNPLAAYLILERRDMGGYYEPSVYGYKDVESFISGGISR